MRITFNGNQSYGFDIPVTLRSKTLMTVVVTLKDGTELTYNNVVEYDHMWKESWDTRNQPYQGCIELEDGSFMMHPVTSIESVHVTSNP